MTEGPLIETLLPSTHDIGGFQVHRVLPQRARTMIGPFIFFDRMGPGTMAPGNGLDVRPHPHINLATVTYLFAGAIDHRDSLGTFATIEPGAVNLMTAGSGIVHSERSPLADRTAGPHLSGLQTWLALPMAKEEMAPAFEHVAADALPLIEAGGASARIIMGTLWGETAPVTCHSPTIYADITLAAGGSLPIDATADERGLFLTGGEAEIDGLPLQPTAMAVLRPGAGMTLRSATGGRVILCGGAPMDGPRHVWWNFVSSSRDRIDRAKADWRAGRFPKVPGDDHEHIPLPEVPKTVSYP